ncbi:hypothetical protein U1Q18_038826 [Sarracenia purpurea var. burkii]
MKSKLLMLAIDDAGHDRASIFKVKALEAVDRAIGQLARLLWQAESIGNFEYFLCITGDHSTPVEYGDHSFEPVPFSLCRLKDFVGAVGGESVVLETPLDPFPLPSTNAGEDLTNNVFVEEAKRSGQIQAFCGDSVCEFNEISAARGCLGRFPGDFMAANDIFVGKFYVSGPVGLSDLLTGFHSFTSGCLDRARVTRIEELHTLEES